MATVEALTNPTPRYYGDRTAAYRFHYTEGGLLWQRKEGQSSTIKPFASGVIQKSRLDMYDLLMVDGRQPTQEDIDSAIEAVMTREEQV